MCIFEYDNHTTVWCDSNIECSNLCNLDGKIGGKCDQHLNCICILNSSENDIDKN